MHQESSSLDPNADRPVPMTQHGPVLETERIVALDVLRGFALLGIFMVNMQFFALPFMHAVADPTLADAPASEVASWFFVKVFFEYKFISLFSMLFGMGMVVQMTRAGKKGRPFGSYYIRRTILLAVFGLVHALLLWYGDILFIYAWVSLILFAMRGLKPQTLLKVAGGLVVVSLLLSSTCVSLQVWGQQVQTQQQAALEAKAEAETVQAETETETETVAVEDESKDDEVVADTDEAPRGLEAMMQANFDPTQEIWAEAEVRAYQEGPFADAFAFRSISFAFALIAGVFSYGWHVLVMFILGAALMKLDFFSPQRRAWHFKFVLFGFLIGLPLEMLSAGIFPLTHFDPGWLLLVIQLLHEIGSYALCLAYVGSVTMIVHSGALRWLTKAIACIGRTALSNYILQTIIATALMYWWGLAWFGELSRPELIGLVLVIYVGQLVTSTLWLSVFSIGPLEWLWRSLTYLKPQPIMRAR
ncbi:MAG: DUF418 domain-containing protein [Planctomycetota bacterium]|nr:DUF418 domain-containing protein [Planctomycetota bacterium]